MDDAALTKSKERIRRALGVVPLERVFLTRAPERDHFARTAGSAGRARVFRVEELVYRGAKRLRRLPVSSRQRRREIRSKTDQEIVGRWARGNGGMGL